MNKFILRASAFALMTAAAHAADVTWQTPQLISGPTDVDSMGAYFGSWAPYSQAAADNNGLTVNGTTFQAFSDLPSLNPTGVTDGYNAYNNPNTSDANYNTLLQTAGYNSQSGTITVSWGGMTPGDTYLLEIWANDGRGNNRSEFVTGGANTSSTFLYGNAPGNFIIGTFTADGSGSQSFTLDGTGSQNGDVPQINLLQVRDISVTPEPSTMALVTLGGVGLIAGYRRKFRTN
jgi:hypothetical protein